MIDNHLQVFYNQWKESNTFIAFMFMFHRIPINYLLVNLALADILYATFITIDTLWRLTATHPDGMTGTVLCKLLTSGLVAWIAANSSVVTLVAILSKFLAEDNYFLAFRLVHLAHDMSHYL